jgi:hypothetical protein
MALRSFLKNILKKYILFVSVTSSERTLRFSVPYRFLTDDDVLLSSILQKNKEERCSDVLRL